MRLTMRDMKRSLFLVVLMTAALSFAGCDDEESGGGTTDAPSDGTSGTDGTDSSSGTGTDSSSGTGTDTGTGTSTDSSSSGTDTDACVPTTCEAEGAECGSIDDDCGDTLDLSRVRRWRPVQRHHEPLRAAGVRAHRHLRDRGRRVWLDHRRL